MDKQLAKSIGAAARRARKALQLTQEDAAERIGVSVEFYARIERGNSLPSVPTFVRIATALGISADTLLGRTSATSSNPDEPSWEPAPPPSDSPEIRRMMRLLRKASPATLRLVTMLVKEMEKHQRPDGALLDNAEGSFEDSEDPGEDGGAPGAEGEAPGEALGEVPGKDGEVPSSHDGADDRSAADIRSTADIRSAAPEVRSAGNEPLPGMSEHGEDRAARAGESN